MKQKIKIALYWPEDEGIVACAVRRPLSVTYPGYGYTALNFLGESELGTYSLMPDEWEIIMRPTDANL